MLVVLQFPLADVRSFRDDHRDRLPVPHWPRPVTTITPEFVHCFGPAVERRRGADNAWTDEMAFCLARRAVRFDGLGVKGLGPGSLGFRPALAFRRLFSDGSVVARVEIGLTHSRAAGRLGSLDAAAALAVAGDACVLPTRVPQPGAGVAGVKPLLRQGGAIARLYGAATTTVRPVSPSDPADRDSFVGAGNPLLLIELPSARGFSLPPSFQAVPARDVNGALLGFGRLRTRAGVVPTWFLQRGGAARADLRSLRLCLLRLHAEQEALDIVLRYVRAGQVPAGSAIENTEDLNDYLNKATRLINKSKWSGVSQSAILDAFDAAERVCPPASRATLVQQFDGALQKVWRKIEDYQARRAATRLVQVTYVAEGGTHVEKVITTNVSGQGNIVNVAEYMNDVTNTVNQHLEANALSHEVADLLRTLGGQLRDVAGRVAPEQTKQMGDDLQALVKELTRPQPRQKWYELALESIKATATAIGEVGKPLLETLARLSPLLMGV